MRFKVLVVDKRIAVMVIVNVGINKLVQVVAVHNNKIVNRPDALEILIILGVFAFYSYVIFKLDKRGLKFTDNGN